MEGARHTIVVNRTQTPTPPAAGPLRDDSHRTIDTRSHVGTSLQSGYVCGDPNLTSASRLEAGDSANLRLVNAGLLLFHLTNAAIQGRY